LHRLYIGQQWEFCANKSCGCAVLCCRWRSDSLTVIKTPAGLDSNKIVKHAYSRYNLSIGIGLSQVRGTAGNSE